METTMGMGKVKVWISEKLGAKIATRVFRGLALGVLLVAGTGLYFSINQGEAGSSLVSERIGCYPEEEYNARPCVSDLSAINPGEAGSPLVSERIGCYPEEEYNARPCVSDLSAINPGEAGSPASIGPAAEVESSLEGAWRFDSPYYDDFQADEAGSPPSINGFKCYPEDDC
jgi:hypothetical protein